ncbi:hypothetical protein MYX78_01085 [Acidobacteria bacterium AH-259-G07]|nr:hypothetical protein [Acidobacteria bacterium AH-259-G07]
MPKTNKENRLLEVEGFYHGTQKVSPDPTEAQIDMHFRQLQEKVRLGSVKSLKYCQAKVETLKRRKDDIEHQWRELKTESKGIPPQIVMPFLSVVVAALAVSGEVVLLAPVMDGFGIAARTWQLFTALVLVLVSSGLIELSIRQIHHGPIEVENDHQTRSNTTPQEGLDRYKLTTLLTTVLLAVFTLTLIFVLGWWRAEEMIFAASQQQGAWGSFLGQNQRLTRVCVILLTTGLPIFAAVALDWGISCLGYAREWRKTRQTFEKLSQQLDEARMDLEVESETRDCHIATLEAKKKEWINAYLANYEMGRIVGAKRKPLWQVVVKIAPVTLLLLAACLLLDPILVTYLKVGRLVVYFLTTFGLAGLYAYRVIKKWDRPTPSQLYKQRALNWCMTPASEAEPVEDETTSAIPIPEKSKVEPKIEMELPSYQAEERRRAS